MDASSPGRSFKEEFQLAKFGLGYPDPDSFVRSQWHTPKWFYFVWRLFWFLWHLGWIVASGITTRINSARDAAEGAKWFIYLTNTTLLLTTLTTTVDFGIVLYVTARKGGSVLGTSHKVRRETTEDPPTPQAGPSPEEIVFHGEFTLVNGLKQHTTPWYIKCMWLLYNIISSNNIIITIMYWAVEYEGGSDVPSVEVHSINTVFIILNILISAMPVQIIHFIYPMAYIAVYFLFNFIYTASGGTDLKGRNVIYTILTWSKPFPTAAVVILGTIVAIPMAHVLVFAFYTFRLFIYSKIYSASYSTSVHCIRQRNKTADIVTISERVDNTEMAARELE